MNICEKANFKLMFIKHHKDLERFILSKGSSSSDALDIAQESFLRLWQKCKEVSEKSLKSFLLTTSERIFIDRYRKEKTKQKFAATLSFKTDINDGQYQLELEEFKIHLEKVISSMKTNSREVFMLHRFEKMKYREISERIGITQKAVEKRMQDALLHLAKNQIPKIR